VKDGERFAPVALTAKEPVAQFEVDLLLAQAAFLQPSADLLFELRCRQAIERTGVYRDTLIYVRLGQGI